MQTQLAPNPNYMDNQGTLKWPMRSILVDWLVQVHARFGFRPETLHLSVNLIDRFLTTKRANPKKLRLLGLAALLIAAKHEETRRPSVHTMIDAVGHCFSAEELVRAENYMLGELHFELGWPGPMSWLRGYNRADEFDPEVRTVAEYLTELTLLDERFLKWSASHTAAAGYRLSQILRRKGSWVSCKQNLCE